MDRPRCSDRLGVNKIGKNIRKSLSHKSSSTNVIGMSSATPQSQPRGYNISKNHLTSTVEQLTDSPLHESFPQPPLLPLNPPKTQQNTWLQKVRPVALAQINQPHVPPPVMARLPMHSLQHGSQPMMGHGDQLGFNTGEYPVSLYPENSLGDSGPNENQMQPSHEYQTKPQVQGQAQLHRPPQFNGSASSMPILPTPRFNGPPQQMYSNTLPSPRFIGRGLLPSPPSQNLLQSPSAYRNSLSPRSPYSLLSPGVQYPPPHTPRSSTLSSMDQPGILGPGTNPQPPASSGLVLPSSPYGIFPVSSPRWRHN